MRVLLTIFLFLTILSSCGKAEDDTLERVNDTIVGSYGCKYTTIQDFSLNLNGYGVTGNDFLAEFKGLDVENWLTQKMSLRIYPVKNSEKLSQYTL